MNTPKPSAALFPVRYTPLNEVKEPITKLLKRKSARQHFRKNLSKGEKK